jgi:type II secretory pathway pseudopilin PulG
MKQKGQSLFELVFALGIISLVLVAVVSLTTKSLSNSTFSKNNSLAARYNQQAMEWVRGQRDTDWDIFIGTITQTGSVNSSVWCINNLTFDHLGNCGTNEYITSTLFKREMSFNYVVGPPVEVQVVSTVSWQDPSGPHDSQASTTLTKWK